MRSAHWLARHESPTSRSRRHASIGQVVSTSDRERGPTGASPTIRAVISEEEKDISDPFKDCDRPQGRRHMAGGNNWGESHGAARTTLACGRRPAPVINRDASPSALLLSLFSFHQPRQPAEVLLLLSISRQPTHTFGRCFQPVLLFS